MAFRIVVVFVLTAGFIACSNEKEHPRAEQIPGTYMNTYSVDVIDPETGDLMGSRTVRDTIFIKMEEEGYEVTNRKWLLNDYDGMGWVDSMQGEIEPMAAYKGQYDVKTGILSPLEEKSRPPLTFEGKKIFWGELRALEYLKVNK
jgi:hypothetical protein